MSGNYGDYPVPTCVERSAEESEEMFNTMKSLADTLIDRNICNLTSIDDTDDLRQIAYEALWRACLTYRADRATPLYTSCRQKILTAINRFLDEERHSLDNDPIEVAYNITCEHDFTVNIDYEDLVHGITEAVMKRYSLSSKSLTVLKIMVDTGLDVGTASRISEELDITLERSRQYIRKLLHMCVCGGAIHACRGIGSRAIFSGDHML